MKNAKPIFRHILVLLFLIQPVQELSSQTVYYVSNSGDDGNTGTSAETAWKTIQKVNNATLSPGDFVLFEKGGVWRETLTIPAGGSKSNYVTYSSYGEGDEKPAILASTQLTDWEKVDGYTNVWMSATEVPNPFNTYMSELWFEEKDNSVTWGIHEHRGNEWTDNDYSVLDELVGASEYKATYVGTNAAGHIYIYSPSDPDSRYNSVECAVRDNCIYLNDKEYITIDGFRMRYALGAHVHEVYGSQPNKGLNVTNCEICYSGVKDGSNMYGIENRHSDAYIAYNEIHDCGRRSISLVMYETSPVITQENVIIEHNHLYNGYHTTGVDINNIGQHTIKNITIRFNLIEGDPDAILDDENTLDIEEGDPRSMGIFVANQGFGTADVGNVKIYGNIFKYLTSRGVAVESTHDVEIYNNTFYHFNPTLSGVRAFVYTGENGTDYQMKNITVKNNIFVEDLPDFNEEGLSCIKINYEDRGELTVNNNLYYSPNFEDRIIRVNYGTSHYNFLQWEAYQTDLGYDVDSPDPADPLFIDPPDNLGIQEGSPARGMGVNVGTDLDFYGNSLSSPPDLGAIQYGSEPGGTLADINMDVYPNPTLNKTMNISFPDTVPSNSYTISLYNLFGILMYKSQYLSGQLNEVTFVRVPPGIYFLKLNSNEYTSDLEKIILLN